MSDLFSTLTTAARALEAQRLGLDVVGQNIANVNTPGYTRRVVDLAAVPPYIRLSAGGGVTATGIHAQRDLLIERRLRLETSAERREATVSEQVGVVELSLGKAGQSIDANLSAFFDAFATLAEEPTSAIARNEVQDRAQMLSASFRDISSNFNEARLDADAQLGAAVDEINDLAKRVRALNTTIATAAKELTLAPRDEQSQLVKRMSELVDVTVLERTDGGVDVSVGNGRPLVVGSSAYEIDMSIGASGYRDMVTGGFDLNDEITGGRLGGFLEIRDRMLPSYQAQLDELAYAVATEVNALHTSGFDLSGTAGTALFTFSPSVVGASGAASAIRFNPAIAADASLIVASGTTEAGGNTVARAIAATRDSRVLAGGTATLNDAWGQLVYRVGRDVSNAQAEQKNRSEIVNQVESLRDQVSGISIDEEASLMLRFQRAYEVNARYFRAVDQTLDVLLSLA